MAADNIITLDSWKMAVRIFWKEILKVDMCKSFLCQNCGNLPPTIVFDGIALGCQIKKVKALSFKPAKIPHHVHTRGRHPQQEEGDLHPVHAQGQADLGQEEEESKTIVLVQINFHFHFLHCTL